MVNLVSYINTFSQIIFGIDILLTPASLISTFGSNLSSALNSSSPVSYWFSYLLCNLPALFSLIFWIWFAWFTFYLLILCPFKWIRSVVKR